MAKEEKIQHEYTVPFTVRSYEVDRDGRATLSSICNYFQEAAGLHADQLQFDISQLQKNGQTWVLYKMDVKVHRYPGRWEEVTVNTRPSPGDGLRALRDYELFDKDGTRVAAAVSQWMVLNIKTRRPVRLPAEILELGLEQTEHIIEPNKSPLKTVPLHEDDQEIPVTHAGHHNLDMNGHVNNVTYIDWFTGYLPPKLVSGRRCGKIEVQYMSECTEGDEIYHAYRSEENDDHILISQTLYKKGQDQDTRSPIASAVSKWL